MGQTESKRCRLCGTRLNPKKKQEMEQSLCPSCRKKGTQAVWENRSVIKSFLFGGGSSGGEKKRKEKRKKKKGGKLKKLRKLRKKNK
ncbi:unnamed protein product [Porites evermanni]|uniref:Uncharacterized protein n=2 Tax=Porites TaxID=46719 RepID=A0ABN8REK0_9CNID|nr:unnamed protein product [Porites evermanni]CAH3176658.1 unnamed protein product [Porites lobata]